MYITLSQREAIANFIQELEGVYTPEQYTESKTFWAKDSDVWRCIRQGGTGQLRLVCWYNNTFKPGSKEWRPAILIQAALAHLGKPYSTSTFPAAPAVNIQALLDDEGDNRKIQEELIIPYRHRAPKCPHCYAKCSNCHSTELESPKPLDAPLAGKVSTKLRALY